MLNPTSENENRVFSTDEAQNQELSRRGLGSARRGPSPWSFQEANDKGLWFARSLRAELQVCHHGSAGG